MTVRPLAARPSNDLVEAPDLTSRERGRRLVEDDQLGVPSERPEYLDLLLLGDRQRAHDGVRRDLEAGRGHDALEPLEEGAPPDESEPARFRPEEDVLRDGPLRDERDLLGDEGDPAFERLARRPEADRLALEDELSLVGRDDAGDDLAERRLAGSVLADEGVNGADPDLHRNLVQRPRAAEGLAYPADVEVDALGSHGELPRDRLSPATPRAAGTSRRCSW